MIVGVEPLGATSSGGADVRLDLDLAFRAIVARQAAGSELVLQCSGGEGVVVVVDLPWDAGPTDLAGVPGPQDGVVVRAATAALDAQQALHRSLDAARRWSAAAVVAVEVDEAVGPASALVTAAMAAGARILVLAADAPAGLVRDVRRAADVTEALLVEAAG